MRFKYEGDGEPTRECVAVTWLSHLVLKTDTGGAVVLCSDKAAKNDVFTSYEKFSFYEGYRFTHEGKKLFYRGDTITITL